MNNYLSNNKVPGEWTDLGVLDHVVHGYASVCEDSGSPLSNASDEDDVEPSQLFAGVLHPVLAGVMGSEAQSKLLGFASMPTTPPEPSGAGQPPGRGARLRRRWLAGAAVQAGDEGAARSGRPPWCS